MTRDTAILVIALYSGALWAAYALDVYTTVVLWTVATGVGLAGLWRQA